MATQVQVDAGEPYHVSFPSFKLATEGGPNPHLPLALPPQLLASVG